MKTFNPLILAAFGMLALGAGSAMAQEGGAQPPSFYGVGNAQSWNNQPATANARPVQAGSSDTDATKRLGNHVLPFSGDYGDLANPN
ncbi:MAG: hypothetical protein ABSA58_13100 [Acetobacteraceae bacterium]|jgi:hypothetical protein